MKKSLLNLKGVQELSKNEQKNIAGGWHLIRRCGGDGSFIFVDGKKVCCYVPWSGYYLC
ncbi:hypothetical protein IMCC3317_38260 [Kordia antarctica]|uniref:Uncharacterized protein n=1 Tax=Kordia antarctica TaxID=1218801 RepID=A0A7L4ZNY6_9FLAO|nr:hypothetical protein [Kordia antarctica]QHI38433.1 hypothetical protein IMCC3317_38260 [Kordia antarctica]